MPPERKFRPLGDRITVKRSEAPSVTESEIIIPDKAKEPPLNGRVVAIGPSWDKSKGEVAPGDLVLFSKYAGTDIVADGQAVVIMRQDEVLGTVCMERLK